MRCDREVSHGGGGTAVIVNQSRLRNIFTLCGVVSIRQHVIVTYNKMYSTPELSFTNDPRVPEQQKDLLISFTLPPELPKNWVRPWLGMAAIKRPIPAPNSTVPICSTRICQRENIGRNLLHEQ